MTRLSKLKSEPQTIPSRRYPGATYTLRRLGPVEMEAATALAHQALRAARDGLAALAPYGFDEPDADGRLINLRDPLQMMGVGAQVAAVEVLMRALSAWTGWEGDDGKSAPIDRPHLSLMLQDYLERDFLMAQVDQLSKHLAAEGNG